MGPTLFIYVPAAPDPDQLDALLQREAIDVTRQAATTWSFWLAPSTCQVSVAIVPFGTESDGRGGSTESLLEPLDQKAYLEAPGFLPVASIQIDNYCTRDPVGHSLLGRFAARLARMFSGIIDLGGALLPASVVSSRPGALSSAVLSNGGTVHLVAPEVLEACVSCEDFYLETYTLSLHDALPIRKSVV